MRYSPYAEEVTAIATMKEYQLLEYFLTRVFETEEVWGLSDGCDWIIVEKNNQVVMPVWPYQQFAQQAVTGKFADFTTEAESLEEFIDQTIAMLIDEDAMLEIMPGRNGPSCLITPHRLYDILTGMIDAGEYRMDG